MRRLASVGLAVWLLLSDGAAFATGTTWRDRRNIAAPGGTYSIMAGIWTRNGTTIGSTFPSGGVINGAGTLCDTAKLTQRPNDHHTGADTYTDVLGRVSSLAVWTRWDDGQTKVSYPIIVGDGSAERVSVMIDVDFQVSPFDPFIVLMIDGRTVYTGLLSGAPLGDLGLASIGKIRLSECCAEDMDDDCLVGFTDLLSVLSAWGPCPGCPQDLDGDGIVGPGTVPVARCETDVCH